LLASNTIAHTEICAGEASRLGFKGDVTVLLCWYEGLRSTARTIRNWIGIDFLGPEFIVLKFILPKVHSEREIE
jgi:hypothetical protein